jgi:hypothetical protein
MTLEIQVMAQDRHTNGGGGGNVNWLMDSNSPLDSERE